MAPQTILSSVCLTVGLVVLSSVTSVPLSSNVTISNHAVILVVSYDGFRADYFGKTATPALDSLKANGVRVPYMQPVFPTKTFPNHHSISTGLYAETHGIVDNTVFDPLYNKILSGFNDDPGFWNFHPEVLPIWLYNELAGEGRVSGCLMWPGSSQPFGSNDDLLPTYYPPRYDGSVPWENRVDTVISWMTNESKPANLVFLYFDEPDTHGHAFGPNAPETIEEVAKADNRTAYLIEKLKEVDIFDKINLILLSDHGMKEVTPRHVINTTDLIDRSMVNRTHGGTPVMHLTANDGRGDDLYNSLLHHSETHNFTIWKKEEMREPHFYTDSRRILDYVMVADPGYAFDDFYRSIENYNSRWNLTANDSREYGVHGYTNNHASMRPFFLAHGPAFKEDLDHAPIRNVDIVPLISRILGLPEPPNNGSMERVADMINSAYLRNSRSSGHQLSSVTNVLILVALICGMGQVV